MGMSEGIIVAAIAAASTVLAAFVQIMRKENREDHGIVATSLDRIEKKLDDHIDDHLKGEI